MFDYLNIYKGKTIVGTLRETDGKLLFEYDPLWILAPDAQPLTEDIPLQAGAMSGDNVDSFFSNLLPEGDVLQMISKWAKISPDNIFALLSHFGGDTSGAYYVLTPDLTPDSVRYMKVTPKQIREWIHSMRSKPLVLNAAGARISLSGAQDKISLMVSGDELFVPIGAAPSTHILKPRIDGRHGVEHSAVNESLVMALGEAVGLSVAKVVYRGDLLSALIERYDRRRGGSVDDQIERLHQLDICQLLNIHPSKKYEAEGGPSFKDCYDVMRTHTSTPVVHARRLLEWLVFNVVVGNMDSHAKNLSILYIDNKKELAPFYDLLCTSVYNQLSQRLAFKIGRENRPRWIMPRHWDRLAEELAIRPTYLRGVILDIANKVAAALPSIIDNLRPLLDAKEKRFIDLVAEEIMRSAKDVITRNSLTSLN